MQAIIKISITELGSTVTNVVAPDFNKDDMVKEQQLLIHTDLMLKILHQCKDLNS